MPVIPVARFLSNPSREQVDRAREGRLPASVLFSCVGPVLGEVRVRRLTAAHAISDGEGGSTRRPAASGRRIGCDWRVTLVLDVKDAGGTP
jgi:hypothetical protein